MSNDTKALTKKRKKPKDHVKYSNPRMRKLVSELASGKPPVEAGLNAGYSENYCKTRLYSMMKTSDSFRQLVEQRAKHSVELIRNLYRVNLLPRAFSIDDKMLDEFEKDPKLAMKHPQALTRVHRIAGTLEDEMPRAQFIEFKTLVNIQNYFAHQERQKLGLVEEDEETIDAEVIQ